MSAVRVNKSVHGRQLSSSVRGNAKVMRRTRGLFFFGIRFLPYVLLAEDRMRMKLGFGCTYLATELFG